MKRCQKCERLYPLTEFTKDLSKKDSKNIYCRSCCRKQLKENRKKSDYNAKRKKSRYKYRNYEADYMLKFRYGITREERTQMLENQGNVCKICKTDDKRFVIDHCHKTGKIRGLLCDRCNLTLGRVEENIEILSNMISYLGDF